MTIEFYSFPVTWLSNHPILHRVALVSESSALLTEFHHGDPERRERASDLRDDWGAWVQEIRDHGVLEPLKVVKDLKLDCKYYVIDGRHRLQAAKEAGNMVDLDSNPTKLLEIVEIGSGGLQAVPGFPGVFVIAAGGHTPGSQCFYVNNCLVSGDTLFLDGCGRTDLPGGDPEALYHSLTETLARVPDDAILFPGHQYSVESSDLLGDTRARNVVFKPRSAEQWLRMFGPG